MLNSEAVRTQAREVVHGVGRPRLKLAELKKLYVPVAPRESQDELVAVLAAQLAAVRDGVRSFEDAIEGLRNYRISVLHELLSGHPERPLGEVAAVASGITKGRKTRGVTKPRAFVRQANVRDGKLDLADVKTIAVTDDELQRYRLVPGDTLMVEGSGSPSRLGQGWLWEGQVPDCLHQNHVFRARPNQETLLPRFLAWVLQSPLSRAYFLGFAKTTSGLSTVNKRQVSSLPIPIPPPHEQARIVDELDLALRGIDGAQAALLRQLAAADSLRTALRTSAGMGTLVTTAGHPQDNADALLQRIQGDHREYKRARKKRRAVRVQE
jgi:type I restriction enzyme S subunit